MENDYLYFWDTITPSSVRVLLGEVQIGYNISFSIDGSKDTAKFIVQSLTKEEALLPKTLCYHTNTYTWWVVKEDKVERRTNENGYLYIHNIELDGAIELFNARDLTDCGFYQNTYTIDDFIHRLLSLSNFEFSSIVNIDYGEFIDKNTIVDYIKTFANYTLLSALREFMDGYNSALRLSFNQNIGGAITEAVLTIIPKTGNTTHDINDLETSFNEEQGIEKTSSESYGTTVVSNADNIASTKSKTFPTIGFVRLSASEFYVTGDNAMLRLPSAVKSVEYVDMTKNKTKITIIDYSGSSTSKNEFEFDVSNLGSYQRAIQSIRDFLEDDYSPARVYVRTHFDDDYWNDLSDQAHLTTIENAVVFRLYDTKQYDPFKDNFINPLGINRFTSGLAHEYHPMVLADRKIRDGVQKPYQVVYYEKGSNLIKGFDLFTKLENGNHLTLVSERDAGVQLMAFACQSPDTSSTHTYYIIAGEYEDTGAVSRPTPVELSIQNTKFRVKYIPMTDLKIKYDNSSVGKDIKLYNQNGKYTDGVALSKLLLSYKNEIENGIFYRFYTGYSYNSMPKVGDLFSKDGDIYVVGNASYTFYQNEVGAFVYGAYTLSKNVATKSIMVNPNTNIRDYGIPQDNNIKRKQLYRDFYELAFESDVQADNDKYLEFNKIVSISYKPNIDHGHTALVKCKYAQPCGGGGASVDGGTVQASDEWYYQVDSTKYYMKKSFYEVFDFLDNNIIGYDSQNQTCGFDIRRLLEQAQLGTTDIDIMNTPIEYTDDKGNVEGIYLSVCNEKQLVGAWDNYADDNSGYGTYDGSLYSRCVFIPKDVYDYGVANCDYMIEDANYKKDALEVPVFEYACQIDDSDDVIIGDEILTQKDEDLCYIYEAIVVPHGKVNNNSWLLYFDSSSVHFQSDIISINDRFASDKKVVRLTRNGDNLELLLFGSISIPTDISSVSYQYEQNSHDFVNGQSGDVDLMIVRYAVPQGFQIGSMEITNARYDLFAVVKHAKQCPYNGNLLTLCINHYRLH